MLALAGRNWEVTHVDWARRIAYVRATTSRGKSRWLGARSGMSFEQARSVSALLAGSDVSPRWSRRACDSLAVLRADAIARETSTPTVTRNPDDEDLEWWTYAGFSANRLIADAASQLIHAEAVADDFKVTFSRVMAVQQLHDFWQSLLAEKNLQQLLLVPANALAAIKFAEALPPWLAVRVYRDRVLEHDAILAVLLEFAELVSMHMLLMNLQILVNADFPLM